MKSLLLTLFFVIAMTTACFAASQNTILFNNLSTTGVSNAVRVGYAQKSAVFAGYSNNRGAKTALPGTVVLQCAPTINGPWVTCKDRGNTAATTTDNTLFNLEDAVIFVRASFTKTKPGNIKAWILGLDQ